MTAVDMVAGLAVLANVTICSLVAMLLTLAGEKGKKR